MIILRFPLLLLILSASTLLPSCGQRQEARKTAQDELDYFFNLKEYFQKEVQRLPEEGPFTKRVQIGDEEEEKVLDSLNWEQELRPLINADINRAGWVDRYRGDTTYTPGGALQEIHYQAQDKELRVREMRLFFDSTGAVQRILIEKGRESLTVDNYQRITYLPAEGYVLVNRQATPMTKEQDFRVEVRWAN